MRFILATGNPDKVREITEILASEYHVTFGTAPVICEGGSATIISDHADTLAEPVSVEAAPDVEENGGTLLANARIKARAWCDATGLPAIADDTGLFVDALDGAPGVDTAYYAGVGASYEANVAKLLDALAEVPDAQRGAHFATVALAAFPDGREVSAEGRADGRIAADVSGNTGFGYDPVFIPDDGDGRRFAEMDLDEKHARSHRGRAFRALAAALATSDLDTATSGRGD